ncbi:hypothetical protein PYCC9005_005260 [Savitreella phatthalungensis]
MGGRDSQGVVTQDVYTLDLSNLTRSAPTWSLGSALTLNVTGASAIYNHTSGQIWLFGGDSGSTARCDSNITIQARSRDSGRWSSVLSGGQVPLARNGIGIFPGPSQSSIRLFGGRSSTSCTSKYYYNSLYDFDPHSGEWQVLPSANAPIAEADFATAELPNGNIAVLGGESAGMEGKASWVSMTQLAVLGINSSSWNYFTPAGTGDSISARSGHTAVSNGTSIFVFGGSVGGVPASPSMFRIDNLATSPSISTLSLSIGPYSPPTTGLTGHAATMTPDGTMVIAFGVVGAANSTTYNDQVYLYDTVSGAWRGSYAYSSHVASRPSARVHLGNGPIAAILLAALGVTAACACMTYWYYRRKAAHRRRQMRKFARFDSQESAEDRKVVMMPQKSTLTDMKARSGDGGLQLPPWASMHVCQARSISPLPMLSHDMSVPRPVHKPPVRVVTAGSMDRIARCAMHHQNTRPPTLEGRELGLFDDNAELEIERRMVQLASPPSPREVSFTAPRMLLRVTNPSAPSRNPSLSSVHQHQIIRPAKSFARDTRPLLSFDPPPPGSLPTDPWMHGDTLESLEEEFDRLGCKADTSKDV